MMNTAKYLKSAVAFALALLTLLFATACGTVGTDSTVPVETEPSEVTETTATEAPVTEIAETDAPKTEPAVAAKREDFTIPVKADAYVINKDSTGDVSGKNFGSESEIHLKSNEGVLTRYGFVKFDISELVGYTGFTAVELGLTLTTRQTDAGNPANARVSVYGCSNEWSEDGVTFVSQPQIYGLVSENGEITAKPIVYNFSVTDYVRQALERGETEVSFYLKDTTPEAPIHIRFSTKEGAAGKAPTLSVYYDTKVDNTKYNYDPEAESAAKISESGLDAIAGVTSSQSLTLIPVADTYVEAGESANTNFGQSEMLDFKAITGETPSKYYRLPILKFDTSLIGGKNVFSATLTMNCTFMEIVAPIPVNVYGCNPQGWNENSVTFNNMPEKEDLVTTAVVSSTGEFSIDVTDYLRNCMKYGDTEVAFILEGDVEVIRRLNFASKESTQKSGPVLTVTCGDTAYSTDIDFEGENPWQLAMENVCDWLNRWEIIKTGGESDVELVERIDAEYTIASKAAYGNETNGYETCYRDFTSRNLDTLIDFTADNSEIALYDVYGGYMGGERYEATGYFYTTKIGDRWWTIDPLGYPFYRVACVQLVAGGSPAQKSIVLSKYGSVEGWSKSLTDRLYELGFNSAGAWSDTANLIKVENPLSQTYIWYIMSDYTKQKGLNVSTAGHTELLHGVMPVFDPDFYASAVKSAEKATAGYAGSSAIYGWFADNELPADKNMLDNALKLDVNDNRFIYSYATAWTFMYMKTGKVDVSINDVTDELRDEYNAMVYDKYFSIAEYLRDRFVPNHQLIGCRFVDNCFKNESIMRVAGYYCDVVSLNYYGVWQPNAELMANMQRWAGKPFIVTEWYAKGMDVWEQDNRMINVSGAGWTVRNQDERGVFYQNYALQLLECKGCVGFDWFQCWDNDPDNLAADLSNRDSNKGIFSNSVNEYTVLTGYMRELNEQKYHLVEYFDAR